jgi:hypothetical protein
MTTPKVSMTFETELSIYELLLLIQKDKKMTITLFRRILMCAGALPSSMFDAKGSPLLNKQMILQSIFEHDKTNCPPPNCPSRVNKWLETIHIDPVSLHSIVMHQRSKQASTHNVVTRVPTVESLWKTNENRYGVLRNVAAIYMVHRALRKLSQKQLHHVTLSPLMKVDVPMLQANEIAGLSNHKKTYETTDQCLKHVYDDSLHQLCLKYKTINDLRRHLLLRRTPIFYNQRRILNEHLVRTNGEIRKSIAEIAYALAYDWNEENIFDIIVSRSAAVVSKLMRGIHSMIYSRKRSASSQVRTMKLRTR